MLVGEGGSEKSRQQIVIGGKNGTKREYDPLTSPDDKRITFSHESELVKF